MKYAIFFDLHDTLVQSQSAWLYAFKKLDPLHYSKIKKMYKNHVKRKNLCLMFNIDYNQLKTFYQNKVKPYKEVVDLLKYLQKKYPIFILSNASIDRVNFDLRKIGLLSKNITIYSKENVKKEDIKFISKIISENSLKKVIMVGNNPKEDVLNNKAIISIIVRNSVERAFLKFKIKKTIKREFI